MDTSRWTAGMVDSAASFCDAKYYPVLGHTEKSKLPEVVAIRDFSMPKDDVI